MNVEFQPSEELVQLLVLVTDGIPTDEQRARLNELINGDSDIREFYVEYMTTHAMLNWHHGNVPVLDIPFNVGDDLVTRPTNTWSWVIALTVAASLLIAIGLVFRQFEEHDPIAMMTNEENAVWGPGGLQNAESDQFQQGKGQLVSGFVQTKLPSGVVIAMQGPVDYDWSGGNDFGLRRGRIRALVPPEARGFAVHAPRLKIVVKGTEFGVWVDKHESVEVHVFSGTVEINGKSSVNKDQARRLTPKGDLSLSEKGIKVENGSFPAIR